MSFIKSFVLVLAALVSTQALATHHARGISHHALGRRLPQILDTQVDIPIKKRSLRKRCKVRPSLPAGGAVGNVGGSPTVVEPTKQAPTTRAAVTTAPPKTTHTTTAETPKTTTKASSGGGGGNLPSYMTGTNTGEATYYGTGLGACGETNKDTDMIAAVSMKLFDTFPGYKGGNPNNNPICGRKVKATLHGKSVIVRITDRCVGCAIGDLDFAPAAFNKIGSVEVGREKGMTWVWL